MRIIKGLIFSISFFYSFSIYAQFPFSVDKYTDSLKYIGDKIINGKSDFERFEANAIFQNTLIFILSHDKAINIDFSEVTTLSVLGDKNNKFKIFTWVVPKFDESYECFGIFYTLNNRKKNYDIIELKDVKNLIENVQGKTLSKGEWWGALYYQIIPIKSGGKEYYTLLGWDGNNVMSNKKVIDVLKINSMGSPSFGASLFKGYGRHLRRIVFEYSNSAQMTVRYEKQAYTIQKKKLFKNKKTNNELRNDGFRALTKEEDNFKIKRKSSNMIVFDRLAPLNSSLKGIPQYYIPETNIVDGFLFIDGKWTYVSDIDARNAPKSQDKIKSSIKNSKIPK